jgi:hypothetical protein
MAESNSFYESPNLDLSGPGGSNQQSQLDQEDAEFNALLGQFSADGVITDEERAILSGVSNGQGVQPQEPAITSTSAANTALNQQVAVGLPNVDNDPSFMSRLSSILYPSGSVGGSGGFGLPPTFTPPSAGATQAQEGTDITPVTLESLGLESAGQKALKESLRQPPSNIDPFTGKTIENPTPFDFDSGVSASDGMTMNQRAIMDSLGDQSQEVAQAQAQTAPTNGLTTVGGASLSEFLSGQAMPERGFTEAEPLSGRGVTLTPDQMKTLNEEREARLDARPDFGTAYSDQELRDIAEAGRTGQPVSTAPTDVFKSQAEAEGYTGRAKTAYVKEKTRLWNQKQENAVVARRTAQADDIRKKMELNLKISKEEREILKAETEKEEKMKMATAAIQGAVQNLSLIEGVSEEIKGLTFKSLTEGNFGRALAFLSPTSTAAQINRMTETIAGDAFVDSILGLKRMGGTVGQVSNAEGEKLTAAKQRLMQSGMSDVDRRKSLEEYMQTKRQSVQNLYNAFSAQYGEEGAAKAFGTSSPQQTGGSGSSIPNDRNATVSNQDLVSKYNR